MIRSQTAARDRPVVLLVNDQEWVVRSLETVLAALGCAIQRAYTGRQALDKARECTPDLVILDFQLPDLTGPAVCRALRESSTEGAALPIFITTASSNGRERQLEALDAGATDFFAQPFDGEVLTRKVRNCLKAKAAYDAVRRAALTDPDTSLYNREGLQLRVRELASLTARGGEPLACIVVAAARPDLADAAASIGRLSAGCGAALRRILRSGDAIGRTDLLEFAVVAPGADAAAASRIVERIEGALADAGFGNDFLPIRAGVAVASTVGAGGQPEALLSQAAESLARAPAPA